MIYLDHAATSPQFPEVTTEMAKLAETTFYNPASRHRGGLASAKSIEASKRILADDLGCDPSNLIVTSCATESINTAFYQLGFEPKRQTQVVYSKINHSAVLQAGKRARGLGFETLELAPDPKTHGISNLEEHLSEKTALVSLLGVNNETGAIADLKSQVQTIRTLAPEALIHADLVQMWQKRPIDLTSLDLDFASFSGHKIKGPKSIGLLYVKNPSSFHPLIVGGGQQNGLRSGTEDPILLGGLAKAVQCWQTLGGWEALDEQSRQLKSALYAGLEEKGIHYQKHEAVDSLPSILNFAILGSRGDTIVNYLGSKGICISNSSACSAGSKDGSYVLRALGYDAQQSLASLRVSFDIDNQMSDIEALIKAIDEVMVYFRR